MTQRRGGKCFERSKNDKREPILKTIRKGFMKELSFELSYKEQSGLGNLKQWARKGIWMIRREWDKVWRPKSIALNYADWKQDKKIKVNQWGPLYGTPKSLEESGQRNWWKVRKSGFLCSLYQLPAEEEKGVSLALLTEPVMKCSCQAGLVLVRFPIVSLKTAGKDLEVISGTRPWRYQWDIWNSETLMINLGWGLFIFKQFNFF